MLYFGTKNAIKLTRGDTAALTVSIIDDITQEEYVMSSTDKLRFSVKKSVNDTSYCFQKEVLGIPRFTIDPEDTKNLSFGKYKYDVELEKGTGAISTIIEPSEFEILPEVT